MSQRYYKLNGRDIAFSNTTEFHVQVSAGRKPYRTIHKVAGEPERAIFLYERIKPQPGRRKRLYMPSSNYPTLLEHRNA